VYIEQGVGHRAGKRHCASVVCVGVDTSTDDAHSVEGPEHDSDEQNDRRQRRLDVLETRQLGSRPHPAAGEDGQPADSDDDQADAERQDGELTVLVATITAVGCQVTGMRQATISDRRRTWNGEHDDRGQESSDADDRGDQRSTTQDSVEDRTSFQTSLVVVCRRSVTAADVTVIV